MLLLDFSLPLNMISIICHRLSKNRIVTRIQSFALRAPLNLPRVHVFPTVHGSTRQIFSIAHHSIIITDRRAASLERLCRNHCATALVVIINMLWTVPLCSTHGSRVKYMYSAEKLESISETRDDKHRWRCALTDARTDWRVIHWFSRYSPLNSTSKLSDIISVFGGHIGRQRRANAKFEHLVLVHCLSVEQ